MKRIGTLSRQRRMWVLRAKTANFMRLVRTIDLHSRAISLGNRQKSRMVPQLSVQAARVMGQDASSMELIWQ